MLSLDCAVDVGSNLSTGVQAFVARHVHVVNGFARVSWVSTHSFLVHINTHTHTASGTHVVPAAALWLT